jgi:hypothetical protein
MIFSIIFFLALLLTHGCSCSSWGTQHARSHEQQTTGLTRQWWEFSHTDMNDINLQFFGPSQALQASISEASKPPLTVDVLSPTLHPPTLQPSSPWHTSTRLSRISKGPPTHLHDQPSSSANSHRSHFHLTTAAPRVCVEGPIRDQDMTDVDVTSPGF